MHQTCQNMEITFLFSFNLSKAKVIIYASEGITSCRCPLTGFAPPWITWFTVILHGVPSVLGERWALLGSASSPDHPDLSEWMAFARVSSVTRLNLLSESCWILVMGTRARSIVGHIETTTNFRLKFRIRYYMDIVIPVSTLCFKVSILFAWYQVSSTWEHEEYHWNYKRKSNTWMSNMSDGNWSPCLVGDPVSSVWNLPSWPVSIALLQSP